MRSLSGCNPETVNTVVLQLRCYPGNGMGLTGTSTPSLSTPVLMKLMIWQGGQRRNLHSAQLCVVLHYMQLSKEQFGSERLYPASGRARPELSTVGVD